MLQLIKQLSSPILSLAILMLVAGLVNTLMPLRLHAEGGSDVIVGLLSTFYYGGMLLSAFKSERLIQRVGHIRAFAAFTATVGAAIILSGLFTNAYVWLLFRLIMGLAIGGLYIVIESWLMVAGNSTQRGQVLSIYMIALYGSQAAGQYLLNVGNPMTFIPFALAALLVFIAILPTTLTRASHPMIDEPSALGFWALLKVSPSGILGAFCAGMVLGPAYGLLPLFFQENGFDLHHVAICMSALIFGGMALQFPVGHLSDRISRRGVLLIVSMAALAVSIAVIMTNAHELWHTAILMFLFGGLTFTLYPLSIAHTCDYLDAKDITAATQGLLLAYGIGAVLGPSAAALVMHHIDKIGLFSYFTAMLLFLSVFFGWRRVLKNHITVDDQERFVAIPRTTPVTSELDPRTQEDGENS